MRYMNDLVIAVGWMDSLTHTGVLNYRAWGPSSQSELSLGVFGDQKSTKSTCQCSAYERSLQMKSFYLCFSVQIPQGKKQRAQCPQC